MLKDRQPAPTYGQGIHHSRVIYTSADSSGSSFYMSPDSFEQRAEDAFQSCLRLLRNVKYRYAKCSLSCYESNADDPSGKEARHRSLDNCFTVHNKFFTLFSQEVQPAIVSST
mmetsp:Transcript_26006/g.46070  ORF Transcript_26006/g.46070 Transcript_26006/m.46070 type:complete len:113 (+) Transcript_26006:966-1304(+)